MYGKEFCYKSCMRTCGLDTVSAVASTYSTTEVDSYSVVE